MLAAAARAQFEPVTLGALERVARISTRLASSRPQEARDLIDEIAAELDGARERPPAFAADPAPVVAVEPPQPVTSRRATFSASSLNAFAECERKWYYRYVCAAVEDRGSSASFYGIAFHAALEDFHAKHVRFDDVDAPLVGAFLDFCMVTAFDRHRTRFDAPVEYRVAEAPRAPAKRYLSWLIEARRRAFEWSGAKCRPVS